MSERSVIEQLDAWVDGKPHHNNERDECCPDFSCCQPDLLAPEPARRAFRDAVVAGNENVYTAMLGQFLGGLVGDKAYVAGDPTSYETEQ